MKCRDWKVSIRNAPDGELKGWWTTCYTAPDDRGRVWSHIRYFGDTEPTAQMLGFAIEDAIYAFEVAQDE